MIVPGSINPLMLAISGDPLDELGKIERSVRFRASAGAVMSRAVTVTGDRKKWKVVVDVKGTWLGTSYCLFDAYLDTQNFTRVYLLSTGVIQFETSTGNVIVGQAITSRLVRDPAAHFELGITFDSVNATAADRMIIEINGVRQSLGSYSAPALNLDSWMNMSGTMLFFGRTGSTALYFDGYLSWPRLTDGQIPAASAYGVSHPRTSQWRPKWKSAIRAAVAAGGGARNGWGTNGFFLPFDEVTSLATLCYDRSQSDTDTTGNNFTATNISLTAGSTYDSMQDTPTNNFCTLNPLANTQTLSNGILTVSASSTTMATHGTQVIDPERPTYFEMSNTTLTSASVAFGLGVASSNVPPTASYQIGATPRIAGFYASNGQYVMRDNGTNFLAVAGALAATDVIQVAVYGTNLWVGKNNVWWDSAGGTTGDPATRANPTVTLDANTTYLPYAHIANNTGHINFGQRQFVYTPPAGFESLCTKGMKRPGIPKSESAFVARTDSGSNIVATLSAAAPFANWIRIYKRRDSAEGWRWQFSDDAAAYLDSSSTTAKAAFPALAGTSYVGYALKVAAANGVATGRLNHVNGVADVVADGLANIRKMIILKNEATGSWYVYHPDLTSGKLLYLEQSAIETTDTSINSVTTSGFTAAAALPSGTYRWIALAEINGFLSLTKATGNSSADGCFVNCGFSPKLSLIKARSGAEAWHLLDAVRDQYNVAGRHIEPNTSLQEQILASMDLVSNGVKLRTSDSGYNSSQEYVGLHFAATPFRYANAR